MVVFHRHILGPGPTGTFPARAKGTPGTKAAWVNHRGCLKKFLPVSTPHPTTCCFGEGVSLPPPGSSSLVPSSQEAAWGKPGGPRSAWGQGLLPRAKRGRWGPGAEQGTCRPGEAGRDGRVTRGGGAGQAPPARGLPGRLPRSGSEGVGAAIVRPARFESGAPRRGPSAQGPGALCDWRARGREPARARPRRVPAIRSGRPRGPALPGSGLCVRRAPAGSAELGAGPAEPSRAAAAAAAAMARGGGGCGRA